MQWIVSGRSIVSQSRIGLPDSTLSITASSRLLRVINLHKRISTSLRASGSILLQQPLSKDSRALATAKSTSCAFAVEICAIIAPVAGLLVSIIGPCPILYLPSINGLRGRSNESANAEYSACVNSSVILSLLLCRKWLCSLCG